MPNRYSEPNHKKINRNLLYIYFVKQFKFLPIQLKEHRTYFSKNTKGFGEEAFHAAWVYLFSTFNIHNALEIGVYRGQVISLWALITKHLGAKIKITGLSPLSDAGDSVSKYPKINYRKDINENFHIFNLEEPHLFQAYSTSPQAKHLIESGKWDLIYIDGSHDYKDVLSDYESAIKGLVVGGILVMDDSSLYTNFRISFLGHPGPSKVLRDHPSDRLQLFLSVGHNNFYIKVC